MERGIKHNEGIGGRRPLWAKGGFNNHGGQIDLLDSDKSHNSKGLWVTTIAAIIVFTEVIFRNRTIVSSNSENVCSVGYESKHSVKNSRNN